LAETMYYKN